MSDDDRQRRRLGDATRDRIADLADGWSVPSQGVASKGQSGAPRAPTEEGIPTAPYERAIDERGSDDLGADQVTTASAPPPEVLEVLRGEASRRSDPEVQKSLTSHRATPPPPPPGARATRTTSPPPVPARAAGTPAPAARGTPAPGREASAPLVIAPEGDDREDATAIDPRHDDATTVTPSPAAAAPAAGATLRAPPRFPRRRGVLGDLRYVATVLRGRRRARRDLAAAEDEITTLRAERAERLADLGRAAVADDRFDQTAIQRSRERLVEIEDQRSRHAGAAAAAEAELDAIDRDRERELARLADELEAATAEAARLEQELAPLAREAAAARKRAQQVTDTLASIDARIAAARASLVSVKGPRTDAVAVEAELATLVADRAAVARDEPAIAAELDGLVPRIASLEAARAAAQARAAAARAGTDEARARAAEQAAAVQARRRVEDRAAAAARTAGDRALADLGERLYAERPDDLTIRLGAVEAQDLRIAQAQRRAIELRDLLASVERGPLVRGALGWLVLLAALAAAAARWLVP